MQEWEAQKERYTWPFLPTFKVFLPHATEKQWRLWESKDCRSGTVIAFLYSGHVAFLADSSGPSFLFVSCACFGKVLSVLCHYKCPFCITPTPAGGSSPLTIGCTFISARTFQKEHTVFGTGKSASPTSFPALPEVKPKISSLGCLLQFPEIAKTVRKEVVGSLQGRGQRRFQKTGHHSHSLQNMVPWRALKGLKGGICSVLWSQRAKTRSLTFPPIVKDQSHRKTLQDWNTQP